MEAFGHARWLVRGLHRAGVTLCFSPQPRRLARERRQPMLVPARSLPSWTRPRFSEREPCAGESWEPRRGWCVLAALLLRDAVVNPVVVRSLQQGCFFLPVWAQTETVNTESIFTRQKLTCGAVDVVWRPSGTARTSQDSPPLWACDRCSGSAR